MTLDLIPEQSDSSATAKWTPARTAARAAGSQLAQRGAAATASRYQGEWAGATIKDNVT